MKKIGLTGLVLLAFTFSWGQLNEKDTIATTVAAKTGSVVLQADVMPDYINLHWTKGPHELIGYFELYRSSDGTAYHLVKQFHPSSFDANDDSYAYRDEDPLRGRNFYRLVSYEKSTGAKRSVDIVADYKNLPRKIQPSLIVKGSQLYLQNYDGEQLHLWIYNSGGNPMVQNRIVNATTVNIPETLSRGVYIYQLLDNKKMQVGSGKLVVQ